MLATVRKFAARSVTAKKIVSYLRKKRLKKPTLVTEFKFPNAFSPLAYKKNYKELTHYNDEQLYQHYKNDGIKQGRRAHSLKDRLEFVRLIPNLKKILEIGPFFNPLTTGNNVSYFDILNREELINRAKELGFPQESTNCPEIHYVSPTGDLTIVKETFDVVLSSHCIEHQPNLVKHLNEVENILNPNGYYFLMVPDKRYCFDHFIPETSLAHVIDVYQEGRTSHSRCSMITNRVLTTHNDSLKHWHGDHGEESFSIMAEKAKAAIIEHENAAGQYIDLHAWYFIPDSFKRIISVLHELSYTQLKIEEIYPSLYGKNEFWAILKKITPEN